VRQLQAAKPTPGASEEKKEKQKAPQHHDQSTEGFSKSKEGGWKL
jgi:hypothetical protein